MRVLFKIYSIEHRPKVTSFCWVHVVHILCLRMALCTFVFDEMAELADCDVILQHAIEN